jgi:hypothetical protein
LETVVQQILRAESENNTFTLAPVSYPERIYKTDFWGGRVLSTDVNYESGKSQLDKKIIIQEALQLLTKIILPAVYKYAEERAARATKDKTQSS